MWILKNSKDLSEYIQSKSLSSCNSIRTLDFSILYTTIPHSKLKDKSRELTQLCFIKKEWPTLIQIPCARKGQILSCKKPLWFWFIICTFRHNYIVFNFFPIILSFSPCFRIYAHTFTGILSKSSIYVVTIGNFSFCPDNLALR